MWGRITSGISQITKDVINGEEEEEEEEVEYVSTNPQIKILEGRLRQQNDENEQQRLMIRDLSQQLSQADAKKATELQEMKNLLQYSEDQLLVWKSKHQRLEEQLRESRSEVEQLRNEIRNPKSEPPPDLEPLSSAFRELIAIPDVIESSTLHATLESFAQHLTSLGLDTPDFPPLQPLTTCASEPERIPEGSEGAVGLSEEPNKAAAGETTEMELSSHEAHEETTQGSITQAQQDTEAPSSEDTCPSPSRVVDEELPESSPSPSTETLTVPESEGEMVHVSDETTPDSSSQYPDAHMPSELNRNEPLAHLAARLESAQAVLSLHDAMATRWERALRRWASEWHGVLTKAKAVGESDALLDEWSQMLPVGRGGASTTEEEDKLSPEDASLASLDAASPLHRLHSLLCRWETMCVPVWPVALGSVEERLASATRERESALERLEGQLSQVETLRQRCAALEKEHSNLQAASLKRVQTDSAKESKLLQLQRERDTATESLTEAQQIAERLRKDLEAKHSEIKALGDTLASTRSDLETVQARLRTREEELSESNLAVGNLQSLVEQLQREGNEREHYEVSRLRQALATAMEQQKQAEGKRNDMQDEVHRMQLLLSDAHTSRAELERMSAELREERERAGMLETSLRDTMTRLDEHVGRDDECIDKAIVTNLIISYLTKPAKQDVLQIMARLLNFTDEQKEVVGLTQPGGWLRWFRRGPSVKQKESLSEMWVRFLLAEAAGTPDDGTHVGAIHSRHDSVTGPPQAPPASPSTRPPSSTAPSPLPPLPISTSTPTPRTTTRERQQPSGLAERTPTPTSTSTSTPRSEDPEPLPPALPQGAGES